MKMSCNGCRVLRKGCSDDCTIRPCLYWIASPDSQANATLFLAKFYGRAGLLNLISAGPPHLRPAIFKSLLYEACGRIVNPVEGTVGLLCSGNWSRCEAAVDGVLRGTTTIPDGQCSGAVTPIASALSNPAIKAFDIRHVSKDPTSVGSTPTKPRSNKPRPTDHINNNNSNKVAIHNFMTSSPAPETNPSPAMNTTADQDLGVGLELSLGIGHQ